MSVYLFWLELIERLIFVFFSLQIPPPAVSTNAPDVLFWINNRPTPENVFILVLLSFRCVHDFLYLTHVLSD